MPTKRELRRQKRLEMIARRNREMQEAADLSATSVRNDVPEVVISTDVQISPILPVLGDLAAPEALSQSETVAQVGAEPPVSVTLGDPRLARIYHCPHNKRMRLVEFQDDKSHGNLFVQVAAPPMLNWVVWVKPDGSGNWILQGNYNSRGVRVR